MFLSPPLYLSFLKYSLILGAIKTNGLITSSKYPITSLELIYVLTNFEMTILSTLTLKFLLAFLHHKIPVVTFVVPTLKIIILQLFF